MSLITFHELVYNHRSPIRASKSAGDQLPAGHHRCEPVRAASGLGWYIDWARNYSDYAKVFAALAIMAAFFSTIMTVLFKARDRALVWQKGVIKW